jgi:hypothetical protein
LVLDQEFQQCEVHLAPDARCSNSIHWDHIPSFYSPIVSIM